MLDVFVRQINTKTSKPIIIIASTNYKEELSPLFLRIFLECQQVGNLINSDRDKLFKWILNRDSVALDSSLIKKVLDHTASFNYHNYMSLLLLSTK